MKRAGRGIPNDVAKAVKEALTKYPELVRQIPPSTILYRSQPSKYDDKPTNYKPDSDTRYADPGQEIGVCYLGCSERVAIAESFQPGQGTDNQAVPLTKLDTSSLHRLKPARILKMVDVAALANRTTNHKIRDLVQAKGQGAEGYELTREFSHACMQQGDEIDGLIYPSAVYTVAGSMEACNLVLFERRGVQVEPIDYTPVTEVVLSNDETAEEFLESLGVVLV